MTRRTYYILFYYFFFAYSDCNAQVEYAHIDTNGIIHSLFTKIGKSDKIKQYSFTTAGLSDTGKFTYVPNSNSNLFRLKWDVSTEHYTLLSNEFFSSRFGPSVFHKFKIERQDSLAVKDQKIRLIDSLTEIHGSRSIAIAALGLPRAINKKNMMFFPFQRNYNRYDGSPSERNMQSWAYDFRYEDSSMDSIVVIFRVQKSLQKWILLGGRPSIGRLDFEVFPTIEGEEGIQTLNVVDSMFFEGDIHLHTWKRGEVILNLLSGYLYDVSDNIKLIGRVQVPEKASIFLLSDNKRDVLWVNYPINWVEKEVEYNIEYYQKNSEVIPIMDFFRKDKK
jgi:hypothetical protein